MLSRAQLQSISAAQLSRYLRERGWIEGSYRDRPLWIKEFEGEEVSLSLPDAEAHSDFTLRIGDLIAVLARFENRRQEAIYEDVMGVGYDVVKAKLLTTENGSISMTDLRRFTDAVFELLREAAAGPDLPARASFSTRYLDAVRVLPAQSGSYVLPIFLPQTIGGPIGEVEAMAGSGDPARRVSLRLVDGLQQLSLVADDDLEVRLQRDPDLRGLAALIGSMGFRERGELEFNFRWTGIAPDERESEESLSLSAPRLTRLAELVPEPDLPSHWIAGGVPQMQQPPPEELPGYVVQGPVVRLARPDAVVEGDVNGKRRRVKVNLDPSQYQLAIAAHAQEVDVRCFGDLVVRSRSAQMVNVQSFEIAPV